MPITLQEEMKSSMTVRKGSCLASGDDELQMQDEVPGTRDGDRELTRLGDGWHRARTFSFAYAAPANGAWGAWA